MTDGEVFPFMETLRSVIRVFPVRGDEHDVQQLGASYFKALRRYPLAMVQAGADRVIQQNKHFPKPAEWLDAIPRATAGASGPEELSAFDRDEWLAAERGRWEQPSCKCSECKFAGVTDRPMRFVPNIDADGQDSRGLIGERQVTRGHWIHGQDLSRWYAAKDEFWRLFKAFVPKKAMYVPPPSAPREPGMEG